MIQKWNCLLNKRIKVKKFESEIKEELSVIDQLLSYQDDPKYVNLWQVTESGRMFQNTPKDKMIAMFDATDRRGQNLRN
jgi:hypothetical protein